MESTHIITPQGRGDGMGASEERSTLSYHWDSVICC